MTFKFYTDGGCSGNKRDCGGLGGWAWIMTDMGDNIIDRQSGAERNVTNNMMELQACIEALKAAKRNCLLGQSLIIVTDSQYLQKGYDEYMPEWVANKWRTSSNKPVINLDRWKQIHSLTPEFSSVNFQWVRGHSTNQLNNMVDAMVQEEISYLKKSRLQ